MKKTLGFILLFAVIMAAFYGLKSWIESGRYQVNAFRAEVTLESDGSMVVSEHWEVRYPQGYSVFFRDIGYRKYNSENPLFQDPLNRASFELMPMPRGLRENIYRTLSGLPVSETNGGTSLNARREEANANQFSYGLLPVSREKCIFITDTASRGR